MNNLLCIKRKKYNLIKKFKNYLNKLIKNKILNNFYQKKYLINYLIILY